MDVPTPQSLPDDIDALKRIIEQQQQKLHAKDSVIARMQTLLDRFQQQRFGPRSEKHPGQGEMQFFNEAELLAADEKDDTTGTDIEDHSSAGTRVAAHTRKPRQRQLPEHLERVVVAHELTDEQRDCDHCGNPLERIGEEVSEQLGIIPQKHYVIRTVRGKYACSCKQCMKTAVAPRQPLPGSQASPNLLANIMVQKFHDGLPLYRQEKIAARAGLDLSRTKLARWLIGCEAVLQPLYNLMQDEFFNYDIALSDDTTIQVLKEDGRAPSSKSALWIRRGGPPDKPVVLVDYRRSKSGETAYGLLDQFKGYLVCDAATNFNKSVQRNQLTLVHCNDHARRRFAEILKTLKSKEKARGWAASKAIDYYKQLYRIESQAKDLEPQQRLTLRQQKAVPIWDAFIDWAQKVIDGGIGHASSRQALSYLLNHQETLQNYCKDGRLPISNIQSEHVAKTIALARKNFLFADTPAGASASAMIYSVLESAKVNGHNVYRYMAVVLSELPNAISLEQIESLLPWNLTTEQVNDRYAVFPTP